jgi:predicted RNA-binding protein YlqC (UPF0109 family)
MEDVTSLIERLVKAITTNKDDVHVECLPLATKTPVRIEVHPSEVGRVIGEHGTHFKALQNIVLAISYKRRTVFELLPMQEPDAGVVPIRYGRFKGQDDWPKQQITELVTESVKAVFKNESAIDIEVRDMTNFCSAYTIKVDRREDADVVKIVQGAMTTLFNAIGRINGRVLIVEIVADKVASKPDRGGSERQPLTPDGRFCKTIRR